MKTNNNQPEQKKSDELLKKMAWNIYFSALPFGALIELLTKREEIISVGLFLSAISFIFFYFLLTFIKNLVRFSAEKRAESEEK